MIAIPMQVSVSRVNIPVGVSVSDVLIPATIGAAYQMVDADTYTGPYEATPTQSEQVFQTNGKVLIENFTVNPIPSNYGLITWDGSVLTVS